MKSGKDISILDYTGKKRISLLDEVEGHKRYIEPFGGSFNAGLNLLKDGYTGDVIFNDLDKEVYDFWNRVKSGIEILETDKFYLKHRGEKGITNNTLKKLQKNVELMQSVKLYNRDAFELIQEYDSEDTFIFIDPPYISGSGCYKYGVDTDKLCRIIQNLKCDWILTYDNNRYIIELYKNCEIIEQTRVLFGKKYTELFIRRG